MMWVRTWIAAYCGLALLGAVGGTMSAPYDIEKIMEKGFKKGGLRHQINTEVNKDKPDWSTVQKKSKEFQELCDKLSHEKPPKGEAESWKSHTQTMLAEAQSLVDFAGKKDQAQTKVTVKKINESCKSCHDAHRE
jgi:cytochrome c556